MVQATIGVIGGSGFYEFLDGAVEIVVPTPYGEPSDPLVVGEVGAILGEVDEQQEFSTLVLDAWLRTTEQARVDAFAQIESNLLAARQQYDGVKQLDDALFGNDLDAA